MKTIAPALLVLTLAVGACDKDPVQTGLRDSAPSFQLAPGNNTEVVTEDDVARQAEGTLPTRSWVLYTRAAGTGIFRTGPETPPAGIGSFELDTPTNADKIYLFNYDHVGTPLADIDAIAYSTYRSFGTGVVLPAINIEVDYNGPSVADGYTVLVYEPYFNLDQGVPQAGVWQSWDAFNGGEANWWSSRPIPGAMIRQAPGTTWSEILAANPDAVILGGFGLNQGSFNGGFINSGDELQLGYGGDTVTYDFEPYRVATNADQCKDGGWETVRQADGSSFKNQGQCVSYTTT